MNLISVAIRYRRRRSIQPRSLPPNHPELTARPTARHSIKQKIESSLQPSVPYTMKPDDLLMKSIAPQTNFAAKRFTPSQPVKVSAATGFPGI